MQKETNIAHGLRWGAFIGLVYCFFLFLRYHTGQTDIRAFITWTVAGYFAALILLLVCGFRRRKSQGGFIEQKDVFQTLFVAVIVFELLFAVFKYVYLKFINPDFLQIFKNSLETMLAKGHVNRSSVGKQLDNLYEQMAVKVSLKSLFQSFATGVVISGIVALVIALIVKRRKDAYKTVSNDILKHEP
jgi:hypothetical protein